MTRGVRVFYRRQSFDRRFYPGASRPYPYWLHNELQFFVRAFRRHKVLLP